jgi:hypothetical protein
VVGPIRQLTLVRMSLSSAYGPKDGQYARLDQPPTLSVGESDTCVAKFGWRLRSEP